MRADLVLVAAVLGAATATCMGRDPATATTVTSASQGAIMTGTGATGGSTPETDMLGTGRASPPVPPPRTPAPPPIPVEPPPVVSPPPAVEPPPTVEPPAAGEPPPAVEPPGRDAGS